MSRNPTSEGATDRDASELVIGLVGPVGTGLSEIEDDLCGRLKAFGYTCNKVRLSEFLQAWPGVELRHSPEHERLQTHMTAGNKVRSDLGRGDGLALLAVSAIRDTRDPGNPPRSKVAHILRSLKHPEEVRTLRTVYGQGFFLVGASAPRRERKQYLVGRMNIPEADAEALIQRDEDERDPAGSPTILGQRTRDTFHLSDLFLRPRQDGDLARFLDLVFGNPFHTPTKDEYAMFLAYASGLRSGDLSRQVGAVITSAYGDIIATGANDVPRAQGGLHWPGEEDQRDHIRGFDANERRRHNMLDEIQGRLEKYWGGPVPDLKTVLKGTALFDVTEFGRPVHAEMEALLSCARSGVSLRGGTLFTTTFPCHNCAKHVVAAGLSRVVFVEPYPKSLARRLHDDSIEVVGEDDPNTVPDAPGSSGSKVRFEQFAGVGPRRFFDIFSMSLSSGTMIRRKREDGSAVKEPWSPESASVRVQMRPTSYIEREKAAAQALLEQVEVRR